MAGLGWWGWEQRKSDPDRRRGTAVNPLPWAPPPMQIHSGGLNDRSEVSWGVQRGFPSLVAGPLSHWNTMSLHDKPLNGELRGSIDDGAVT